MRVRRAGPRLDTVDQSEAARLALGSIWIRPEEAPPRAFGVYHFRKTFDLASAPPRFVIHATADNRYELFVNGQRVATGPARGDLNHWRFETLDIAKRSPAGPNVIAAVVWNFAQEAPMAQVTHETGLLVQGDSDAEAAGQHRPELAHRGESGVSLLLIDRAAIFHEYFVGGPGEQVDGSSIRGAGSRRSSTIPRWTDAEQSRLADRAASATRRRAGCSCRAAFR